MPLMFVIRATAPSHGRHPEYFLDPKLAHTTLKHHAAQFFTRKEAEKFAESNGIKVGNAGGVPYIDEVEVP
jgi:hypothetical protein